MGKISQDLQIQGVKKNDFKSHFNSRGIKMLNKCTYSLRCQLWAELGNHQVSVPQFYLQTL